MTEHPDEARLWADHHQDWSHFLTEAWAGLAVVFHILTDIQYAAPWKEKLRTGRLR